MEAAEFRIAQLASEAFGHTQPTVVHAAQRGLRFERAVRDDRQRAVLEWVRRELISDGTPEQRGRRLVEEACELLQSVGGTKEDALRVVEHVFSRPAGTPAQEVGGVAVTLMATCEVLGLSLADCEVGEFNRVHSFPPGHFHKRQREKLAAGL